ncbi:E3 ubiquitin-protein ligase DTX4-like [Centruroides sculpturatus]|uniref:E3 ubiquitin-protein ligase DTX4-like n=1 Tax=Centruroides sculpturatus TaxID=218467 RepID=UPI000C6CA996|nr:E3 ubiquitin-protein ligase DTX4-like [Centruroides sculpturatus]
MTNETELKSVVWEWMNDRCKWTSYSPEVCHLLERAHERGLNLVCLGDVESRLKSYNVNLREFQQVSEVTGYRRAVRRKLFSSNSVAASGVCWQWAGDKAGQWFIFDMDIAAIIEDAFAQGLGFIDLSKISSSYSYSINFKTMSQKSTRTGFERPVRRTVSSPYPLVRHATKSSTVSTDVGSPPKSPVCTDSPPAKNTRSKSQKKSLMKHFSNFANKIVKLASTGEDDSIDGDAERSISDRSVDGASNSTSEILPLCDKKTTNSRKEARGRKKSKAQSKAGPSNSKSLKTQSKDFPNVPYRHSFFAGEVKPVPGIKPPKTTRSNSTSEDLSSGKIDGEEVIGQFASVQDPNGTTEECIICCENLSVHSPYDNTGLVITLRSCLHTFHKACLKAMYNSGTQDGHLQCPTCKTIYGIKRGNQPRGTMDFHVIPCSLPGYPECDTISIIYNIPPGIQGPEHIHPGRRYTARGFPRVCYLPNNKKGRKVLSLLVKAWERRLIFTVGSSATTGEDDTVTWNEIHHKTELSSNYSGHGWPDVQYLDNVLAELALQGVTE